MICLVWEALNFTLAYRKGQFGPYVVWIGGELAFTKPGVTGQVKQSIVEDIVAALHKFRTENVHSCKELRSFVGRANHAAGLLVAVRPFLHALWGALSAHSTGPQNTVWAKQVNHAMSWLRAFFCDEALSTQRHFSLEEFRAAGPKMEIGTDASPWGLGGWLSVDGTITHFFSTPVSQHDLDIFKMQRGSCDGQQTLESLAILVALRAWTDKHTSRKFRLQVRGDNVGALSLVLKMRPGSSQQALIAREIALEVVHFAFPPAVTHTPGVAHVIADGLSRLDDPNFSKQNILSHPALIGAVRTVVPDRPKSWYKTIEER